MLWATYNSISYFLYRFHCEPYIVTFNFRKVYFPSCTHVRTHTLRGAVTGINSPITAPRPDLSKVGSFASRPTGLYMDFPAALCYFVPQSSHHLKDCNSYVTGPWNLRDRLHKTQCSYVAGPWNSRHRPHKHWWSYVAGPWKLTFR